VKSIILIYNISYMNISDIDLKSLQIFVALVAERNASRVAERVGLSQPAVSHSLGRLRHLFQDRLFVRTRTGMIPTSRALELVEPVKQAIGLLEQTIRVPKEFQPKQARDLFKVGATDYVEWLLLPKLCAAVAAEAPNVQLETESLPERLPFRQLEKGDFDLAIGFFPDAPESLFKKDLFQDEFVVLVGPQFPNNKKTLGLKELLKHRHLLVAPWGGMRNLMDRILEKKGMQRAVHVSTTHFLVAPMIVMETDYVVTLPRQLAESFAKLLPVRSIEHPVKFPPFSITMLWHNRTHYEAAHKWFRGNIAKLHGPAS